MHINSVNRSRNALADGLLKSGEPSIRWKVLVHVLGGGRGVKKG